MKKFFVFISILVVISSTISCVSPQKRISGTWLSQRKGMVEVLQLSQEGKYRVEYFYTNGKVYNGPFEGTWFQDEDKISIYNNTLKDKRYYKWTLSDEDRQLELYYEPSHTRNKYQRVAHIDQDIRGWLISQNILHTNKGAQTKLAGISLPTKVKADLTHFRILGWSKASRFAWQYDWHSEGRPSSGTTTYIVDLVSDKILEKIVVEEYLTDNDAEKYKMEEVNRQAKERLVTLLSQYGIQNGDYSVFGFPVSGVRCELAVQYEPARSMQTTTGQIYNWDFELIARKGDTSKIVARGSDKAVISKAVAGYSKSPFENRIAVIVDTYLWGIENDNQHQYGVYGCNLNSGFKK